MSGSAGSYGFDGFAEQSEEIARLKLQARVALAREQAIWKGAGLQPGMRVLDMGCGPGHITAELAKQVGPGEVVGADFHSSLIEVARALQQSEGISNLSFVVQNVYELELPEESFDFIYTRLLLEHLADPVAALRQMVRRLKPGGILCALNADQGWLSLSPEPAAFPRFIAASLEAQRAMGGDPFCGHKLHTHFHAAGLREVRLDVHPVTSHQIGMHAFLELATGLKRKQLPEALRPAADEQLREVYALVDQPGAWGAMGIFVAAGRR